MGLFCEEARAPPGVQIGAGQPPGGSPITTILFISLSAAQCNLEADWAEAGAHSIPQRRCPVCLQDSIIGHGRRRKQAHDQDHDWIPIRRGLCRGCGKTFTFLPPFSPPYCLYSLIARSQALRSYFAEHNSWEAAAPVVKDPDRVADPSTLRRWFRSLDSSAPPFSFLRGMLQATQQLFTRRGTLQHDGLRLSWHTVFPFLNRFWPLRI